ncbi:hypothetical protein CYLTODRAFT_168087 [Cylindrobasidium torrendii FP15055 ss-10]|uniref:Uncharacterized protein n=1 Tax=Cylindrobasidium torrendii FP15055 ss-10 TaxID=1314674 RepID=A0A0D7BKW6_9AGAR|nr:hypothetical protein CYLTODRAFT_168087 [Cylindrobasidium torrendii FP15055 ss-10]
MRRGASRFEIKAGTGCSVFCLSASAVSLSARLLPITHCRCAMISKRTMQYKDNAMHSAAASCALQLPATTGRGLLKRI